MRRRPAAKTGPVASNWPNIPYFANTNASRSDASYWLCRPQPLLALAATYNDSANAAIPSGATHGPRSPAAVPVNVPGFVDALTCPLVAPLTTGGGGLLCPRIRSYE